MTSTTWILNINIPANWKAYQPIKAKITIPEAGVTVDEYQAERNIIIEDVFTKTESDVDYIIRIVVDRRTIANVSKVPVSMLRIAPDTPMKIKAFEPSIGITRGRFVSFEIIPLSDTTSAVNHTVFVSVKYV